MNGEADPGTLVFLLLLWLMLCVACIATLYVTGQTALLTSAVIIGIAGLALLLLFWRNREHDDAQQRRPDEGAIIGGNKPQQEPTRRTSHQTA
jgi:Flp pilus assembly protein TadB